MERSGYNTRGTVESKAVTPLLISWLKAAQQRRESHLSINGTPLSFIQVCGRVVKFTRNPLKACLTIEDGTGIFHFVANNKPGEINSCFASFAKQDYFPYARVIFEARNLELEDKVVPSTVFGFTSLNLLTLHFLQCLDAQTIRVESEKEILRDLPTGRQKEEIFDQNVQDKNKSGEKSFLSKKIRKFERNPRKFSDEDPLSSKMRAIHYRRENIELESRKSFNKDLNQVRNHFDVPIGEVEDRSEIFTRRNYQEDNRSNLEREVQRAFFHILELKWNTVTTDDVFLYLKGTVSKEIINAFKPF